MLEADPRTRRRFKLRLLVARAVVTFEQTYPLLWPLAAVLGGFLVAAWFDIFEALPVVFHALLLIGFAVAFAWAGMKVVRGFALAGDRAGLARLERDSAMRHEALRALGDELPAEITDPTSQALWRVHRERLLASLARIRLQPPRSDLPRRDPWAMRAALLLALVVALVDARGEYGARLLSAFTLVRAAPAATVAPTAALWVSPPPYTRRAPLAAEQTAQLVDLEAPAGSEILAQVHHLPTEETDLLRLTMNGTEAPFTVLGDGSAEFRGVLEQSGELVIGTTAGRELARWAVTVQPDGAPVIAFKGEPGATHRGVLRVDFAASDDYGLKAVELVVTPKVGQEAVERFGLAKPQAQPSVLETGSFLDLTAHPLAGQPVELRLEALDGIDQRGVSEPLEVTLPERAFRHPLARAVIEQRKRLVAEPEEREDIAGRLAVLGTTPLAGTMGAGIPLSLYIAGLRTRDAETLDLRREVVQMLWELALFIEDGDLSDSERELRALQEQLQQALEENASDAELERLMAELQEALNRFLDELQRQAMEQMQQMTPEQLQQMQPMDPSQMVDRNELQEMLDRAREMMRSGARDAARDMLAQLQQMLENLQTQMAQPQQMGPQERAMSDLQKMIQMQQQLLDRSFQMQRQQGQQGQEGQQQQGQQQQGQQQGQQPGDQAGRAAAEQEALRRALGELMRRMGEAGMEIPRSLGQAEMQMRGARDSLEQGQPGQAAPSQNQALDLMQQGGQAMMEQLQQQYGQQMGPGPGGEPFQQGRRGRDPMGRAQYNDGGFDPRGEFVPDDADLGRARDVLEELYRRSGERARPQIELDYYNRLLDRF